MRLFVVHKHHPDCQVGAFGTHNCHAVCGAAGDLKFLKGDRPPMFARWCSRCLAAENRAADARSANGERP